MQNRAGRLSADRAERGLPEFVPILFERLRIPRVLDSTKRLLKTASGPIGRNGGARPAMRDWVMSARPSVDAWDLASVHQHRLNCATR